MAFRKLGAKDAYEKKNVCAGVNGAEDELDSTAV